MSHETTFSTSRASRSECRAQIEDALARFVRVPQVGEASADEDLPMISVIVPSYNQAAYLERTLLSILNQRYPKLDLIVMDGGSTDGSVDVIERYQSHLTYWQSKPDGGQTAAINAGMEKARGELICYQNSDDLFLPGALLEAGKLAQERPDADFIAGDMLLIDADDKVLDVVLMMPELAGLTGFVGMPIVNQASFWRRRLIDRIGGFDEAYRHTMDYEFFTRALASGAKVAHRRALWGAFRIHEEAKTATQRNVWQDELAQVDKAQARILRSLPLAARRRIGSALKLMLHMRHGEFWYLARRRYRV